MLGVNRPGVTDLEPGTVLRAWHSKEADSPVATFVDSARSMLATTRADVHNRGWRPITERCFPSGTRVATLGGT